MVEAFHNFHPHLLHFLNRVHQSTYILTHDGLSARNGMPSHRTLYRWHARLGDGITYYPTLDYEALGLVHWHLLIEEPTPDWERWPYAIKADWVVQRPGAKTLYLHCLIPRVHEIDLQQIVEEWIKAGCGTSFTLIKTGDGAQLLRGMLSTALPDGDDVPVLWRSPVRGAWELVERYPLIIPVIFEMTEHRRSMPQVWTIVRERLGDTVWTYLPRGAPRLPHNGKAHVRDALRLISDSLLVRQYLIRFAPLQAITMDLLAVIDAPLADVLTLIGPEQPLTDVYPITKHSYLVRVTAAYPLLARFFRSAVTTVRDWRFIDHAENNLHPCPARFQYERVFDPATCEWVLPDLHPANDNLTKNEGSTTTTGAPASTPGTRHDQSSPQSRDAAGAH